MKVPVAILSAIETALNAWLKLDGESLKKCESLEDKIIRLHITGLDLNLFFLPAVSGIQVMSNYPDSALVNDQIEPSNSEDKPHKFFNGEVDATIHGSPIALMRLASSDDAGASILDSDVIIEGDMRVAQAFSAILKEVDIDWEELLSKLLGDILAHQTGQVVRSGSNWFSESVEAMKLNSSEYLSEESKVTPAEAEIEYYLDQVDDVRMDTDRLQARIDKLSASINESNPLNDK